MQHDRGAHRANGPWHRCARWAGITETCPLRAFSEEEGDEDIKPEEREKPRVPVPILLPERIRPASAISQAEAVVAAMEVLKEPAVAGPVEAVVSGGTTPDVPPLEIPLIPPVPPPPELKPIPVSGGSTPESIPSGGSAFPFPSLVGDPGTLAVIAAAFAVIVVVLRVAAPPPVRLALAAAGIFIPDLVPTMEEVEQATTIVLSHRVEAAEFDLAQQIDVLSESELADKSFAESGPDYVPPEQLGPDPGNLMLKDVSQMFVPENPVFQDVPLF